MSRAVCLASCLLLALPLACSSEAHGEHGREAVGEVAREELVGPAPDVFEAQVHAVEVPRAVAPTRLDDPRVYQNVSELQRLQSTIAEGLKRFEFGLRRRVDADENSIVLTGSDEVPEEFRRLVQEYYRSLARTPR